MLRQSCSSHRFDEVRTQNFSLVGEGFLSLGLYVICLIFKKKKVCYKNHVASVNATKHCLQQYLHIYIYIYKYNQMFLGTRNLDHTL